MNEREFDVADLDELDDRCDLDPNKICDNCCKCLEEEGGSKAFRTVMASFLTEDTIIEYAPDSAYIPVSRHSHGDYSTLPAKGRRRKH